MHNVVKLPDINVIETEFSFFSQLPALKETRSRYGTTAPTLTCTIFSLSIESRLDKHWGSGSGLNYLFPDINKVFA